MGNAITLPSCMSMSMSINMSTCGCAVICTCTDLVSQQGGATVSNMTEGGGGGLGVQL